MEHEIQRVTGFQRAGDFKLRVEFEDGTVQVIDFRPVLAGEVFGLLADPQLFGQVRLDPEAGTLVWPNGADFDPATLHNWPEEGPKLVALARGWRSISA